MLSARQGRAIGVTEVYAPKAKGFDLIKNSYGYLVNSSKKRKNDDVLLRLRHEKKDAGHAAGTTSETPKLFFELSHYLVSVKPARSRPASCRKDPPPAPPFQARAHFFGNRRTNINTTFGNGGLPECSRRACCARRKKRTAKQDRQ